MGNMVAAGSLNRVILAAAPASLIPSFGARGHWAKLTRFEGLK